ncbi:MAG: hypothetical protein R3362_07050, partial [Rhodothermales bacterium]|nr:hypothetical protein [Rhodothermales bacterium]
GGSAGGDGASGAERDPSVKQGPVVVDKEPGRNDRVVIMNPATGEERTLKYKHAQAQLSNGWNLVRVEDD